MSKRIRDIAVQHYSADMRLAELLAYWAVLSGLGTLAYYVAGAL